MKKPSKTSSKFRTEEDRIRDAKASLAEIRNGFSVNDETAFMMFAAKGYPVETIIPRVTLLTFNAWKAYGRHVRKAEKGTAVTVWRPLSRKDDAGNSVPVMRRAGDGSATDSPVLFAATSHLFHIAQTDLDEQVNPACYALSAEQRRALEVATARPIPAAVYIEPAAAEAYA